MNVILNSKHFYLVSFFEKVNPFIGYKKGSLFRKMLFNKKYLEYDFSLWEQIGGFYSKSFIYPCQSETINKILRFSYNLTFGPKCLLHPFLAFGNFLTKVICSFTNKKKHSKIFSHFLGSFFHFDLTLVSKQNRN